MKRIRLTYTTARQISPAYFVRSNNVLMSGNLQGYATFATAKDAWLAAVNHAQLDRKYKLQVVKGTHDHTLDPNGVGALGVQILEVVHDIEFTKDAFEVMQLEALRLGVNAHEIAASILEPHYSGVDPWFLIEGAVDETDENSFSTEALS